MTTSHSTLETSRAKAQSLSFEDLCLSIAKRREKEPKCLPVVLVSDLDHLASNQQALSIATQAPRKILRQDGSLQPYCIAQLNNVLPYNSVSAAHTLAACLSDHQNFPPGSIFVVTVDPHVGKNGEGGNNVSDKRVVARYEDGTLLIGPARSYLRVGEFHGRGPLSTVVELDKQRLLRLGTADDKGDDVFDGLRRFGPAAAALLHGARVSDLGRELSPELIPPLVIPPGTITDIEPGYQNIRVEVPCDAFAYGDRIAIRDGSGKLLSVATRTKAFEGSPGDIVAVNGSKELICDDGGRKRALYLASVQGHLAEELSRISGSDIAVGAQLHFSIATSEEIALCDTRRQLQRVFSGVRSRATLLFRNLVSGAEQVGSKWVLAKELLGALESKVWKQEGR